MPSFILSHTSRGPGAQESCIQSDIDSLDAWTFANDAFAKLGDWKSRYNPHGQRGRASRPKDTLSLDTSLALA